MPDRWLLLGRRLRAHRPVKLGLSVLLTVTFCAGYLILGHHPLRPPTSLRPTAIDRAVPFASGWAWVYESLGLLLPVAWLAETSDQLRRYAIGFALLMATGFALFLLWPVAGPRPENLFNPLAPPLDPLYRALVRYDTPLNSFPSLHMALATYSVCTAVALAAKPVRRRWIVALSAWLALIAYATLATKQHYWIDLPPGILLGWLAQRVTASRDEPIFEETA